MIGAKIILYQFNNTMSNPIEMNREDMCMWLMIWIWQHLRIRSVYWVYQDI